MHTVINMKNKKLFKFILMTFVLYNCHGISWNLLYVCCPHIFISYCYLPEEANHLIFASVIRRSYHLPNRNMLIAVWWKRKADLGRCICTFIAQLQQQLSDPWDKSENDTSRPTFYVKTEPNPWGLITATVQLWASQRDPGSFKGQWQCSPAKGNTATNYMHITKWQKQELKE